MSDSAHENEIKIVLRDAPTLEHVLSQMRHKGLVRQQDIQQGYFNCQTRIRRIIENGKASHYLTYKERLPNDHNLEVEGTIAGNVFDAAWPHTHEQIIKRRFKLTHGGIATLPWDIDFYRWSQPYFALAEVEMPPDSETYEVPEVISPYVHHVVARDDQRFAAWALADDTHVARMARDLGL